MGDWRHRGIAVVNYCFLLSWSLHAQHNHHIRSHNESFQNTISAYVSTCPWHWRVPGTVELVYLLLISLLNGIMALWNDLTCDACSFQQLSNTALQFDMTLGHRSSRFAWNASFRWLMSCHKRIPLDHLWDLPAHLLLAKPAKASMTKENFEAWNTSFHNHCSTAAVAECIATVLFAPISIDYLLS